MPSQRYTLALPSGENKSITHSFTSMQNLQNKLSRLTSPFKTKINMMFTGCLYLTAYPTSLKTVGLCRLGLNMMPEARLVCKFKRTQTHGNAN